MADNNHDGMKFCNRCETWKPATAEYFNRDKTRTGGLFSWCKECKSEYKLEYKQKNKDRIREYDREYRQKNKDRLREYKREYRQTPVGRLSRSIKHLRQKTGATIYVRDMTEEQKEVLANQRIAVQTLEKTEKEILAASGKKRCSRCDRVLDYCCFNKTTTTSDGVDYWCGECREEYNREYNRKYYQQNKDKTKERGREYYEKNKEKIKEYQRKYRQKKQKST